MKVFGSNECMPGIIYKLAFYHENFLSKNCTQKAYQKYVHLGENTLYIVVKNTSYIEGRKYFIHCIWITVVHAHVNVFL